MNTRILIADDHEMMRTGVAGVVQRIAGVEVVGEAADGRRAVELARQLRPDITILDAAMPLLNGVEALRLIARELPRVRTVVIADECEGGMVTEALSAGASGFVLKSGPTIELELAVRAARDGTVYLSPKVNRVVVASYLAECGCRSGGTADAVEGDSAAPAPGNGQANGKGQAGPNGTSRSHPPAFSALTPKQREVLQLLTEGMSNKEVAAALAISTKTAEAHRAQIMEKLQIHSMAGLTKYAIREGLTSVEV
jgi:DNA-binding NarL/FixJ family response regulator